MGWEAVQPDNSAILSLDVVGVTLVHKCTMQSDLVGTREVKATTKRTIEMLPTFKLRLVLEYQRGKDNIQVFLQSCDGTRTNIEFNCWIWREGIVHTLWSVWLSGVGFEY